MYQILFTKQAMKDRQRIASSGLERRVRSLLDLLAEDPFRTPPPCEKLVGDLSGLYSRRINVQHRLVYSVDRDRRIVKLLRMWTHYE